ncbi:hypothetical protein GCM10027346_40670 [Hymenobacter seoulensis]
MLPFKKLFSSRPAHKARYHSLGKPSPGIRHVWLCLHGHAQPVAELAARLVNLDTAERLLILPEALALDPATEGPARWFRPGSVGPDLALVRAYLNELVTLVLVQCPAGTPLTVLGYGEGALAATTWLAGNRFPYEQLVLCAAVFPAAIRRDRLFADLPRSPVLVVSVLHTQNDGRPLVRELRAAGMPAHLRLVQQGPLALAALSPAGQALEQGER